MKEHDTDGHSCIFFSSGVTENFWGEVIMSSCFILNRVPQRDSDITLYRC